MPPLESNPSIFLATSQGELDDQFQDFLHGDKQYQCFRSLEDIGGQFHVFLPHGREYVESVWGLMEDGWVVGAVAGEIFPSVGEYQRIRGNVDTPVYGASANHHSQEQHHQQTNRGRFLGAFSKLLGRHS
jgi:hypothetical protein